MRSLIGVFFALVLFVPSAFAQNYGGNYAGNWIFSFSGEIRTRNNTTVETLTVNALYITMPSAADSGGWYVSRATLPNAGAGSYVEFKSHPAQPGTLLVTICYFGSNAQYVGNLVIGDVTAQVINERQTITGGMTIRVIPNSLGVHKNTGIAWVTLSPN